MTRYVAIIAYFLSICSIATAQVNTEAMRRIDLESGWYNRLTLNLSYESGNTDFLALRANFRSDYLRGRYHAFAVTTFQQARKDGKAFTNKGFIHVRGIRLLNQRLMAEIFVQRQFNESILLNERNLAGGGIRITVLRSMRAAEGASDSSLHVGMGAMWEKESLDLPHEEETAMVRSTNYITGIWHINEQATGSATCYYQPSVERFSDFRILFEGNLQLRMTRDLALNIKLNLRYDNEPPMSLEKHDLEIMHGVSYAF